MFRVEVIDFVDPTGTTVAARVPAAGTGSITVGAQLIVHQNQQAVFFREGRAMDVFGPGRHTLNQSSMPVLSRWLSIPWDRAPLQACVYFVSQQRFVDQGWGTRQPITIRDPDFGILRLRGFGKFSFRVVDSTVFVNEIVGTQGNVTAQQITDFLRDTVVSGLSDLLATANIGLAHMTSKFDELAAAARLRIGEQFKKFGLELTDLIINSISPPPEVQQAIDARSTIPTPQDLHSYTQQHASEHRLGGASRLAAKSRSDGPVDSSQLTKSTVPADALSDVTAVQQSLRAICQQSGWTLIESGQQWMLTVPLGPLRKQDVHVDFSGVDEAGHRLVSIWSTCGEARNDNALALLRYNAQLIHGALAVIRDDGVDVLVIRGNLLAETADDLELVRTVTAVAWQANQAQQQFSGQT
ncbi:MAG: SPFH domain-containing protein [Pirellulaceae bacterium]|nr:SPFH domain-containing protein [Pirellulaceae bacterium]